jgi:hypothetical protein
MSKISVNLLKNHRHKLLDLICDYEFSRRLNVVKYLWLSAATVRTTSNLAIAGTVDTLPEFFASESKLMFLIQYGK